MQKPYTLCSLTKMKAMIIFDKFSQKPYDIMWKVNLKQSSVKKQLKKLHNNFNPYIKTLRSNCPKQLNSHNLHQACRVIMSDQLSSVTVVQCEMFLHISARTIR